MKAKTPQHVGFIPDGNRRWAATRGLPKQEGYAHGLAPGLALIDECRHRGIPEVSVYGFTKDNTHRAAVQLQHFSDACVRFALSVAEQGAALLVVGDDESGCFPEELKPYRQRCEGDIRVNLLVNYGWDWDLEGLRAGGELRSQDVSRLDLVVRWGGGRRLSGFLPVQSVYADFYVVDDYWPDYRPEHFDAALDWFARQDRTLGG